MRVRQTRPASLQARDVCFPLQNLKFIHELEIKMTKMHRVISFYQSDWLKEYMDFNTDNRTNAMNAFTRFFKLMHNSVFGKTMGNVNGRMELKLTTDCEKTIKRFSKLHVKVSLFLFLRRATHDRHVLKNGNRIQARICRHDRIRPW